MDMAVRVYLRSPVALAWTRLGGLAVGAVSAVGWLVATILRARAGVADRLLDADDVAPQEVTAGGEPFVVPALVLDAPDALEIAVERANRMTPEPGRERLSLGCLGATALAAGGAYLGGAVVVGPLAAAGAPLAAGLLVVGLVLTAALDAAWRAERYASQDLSEGFVRG